MFAHHTRAGIRHAAYSPDDPSFDIVVKHVLPGINSLRMRQAEEKQQSISREGDRKGHFVPGMATG